MPFHSKRRTDPLSNEKYLPDLRSANFAEVQRNRRRAPSWIAGPSRASTEPRQKLPSAKLPTEFVAAMRQELGSLRPDGHASASERPPPPSGRAPRSSLRPPPPEKEWVVDEAASQAFLAAASALGAVRQEVLAETAGQLAELAAAIARRVIGHELSVDKSVVQRLVAEGLSALGAHDRVVVRVGERFASECDAIEQRFTQGGQRCEVIVDPLLDKFGCLIETDLGQVDESLETRLATLLQALKPDSETPS